MLSEDAVARNVRFPSLSGHSAFARLRKFDRRGIVSVVTAIIYLSPSEQMPQHGEDDSWLIVEASDDDRFFGTGVASRPSGEWLLYCSLPEDDCTLADALTAAERWAAKHSVPTIWVQTTP